MGQIDTWYTKVKCLDNKIYYLQNGEFCIKFYPNKMTGERGSRSNRPQSNRPDVIYIKLNGNTDIWLCSFSLMLRACWRSKNTNFYRLWFDISYRIEKWYSCLFPVAKAHVPNVILSSWFTVLNGQIDVPYVYKPLAMMNFRECFKVNF